MDPVDTICQLQGAVGTFYQLLLPGVNRDNVILHHEEHICQGGKYDFWSGILHGVAVTEITAWCRTFEEDCSLVSDLATDFLPVTKVNMRNHLVGGTKVHSAELALQRNLHSIVC